jgi:hypothetical protein
VLHSLWVVMQRYESGWLVLFGACLVLARLGGEWLERRIRSRFVPGATFRTEASPRPEPFGALHLETATASPVRSPGKLARSGQTRTPTQLQRS